MIGLVLMAIVVIPIIVLIATSIFSAPRTFRVPGLFMGSLVVLFITIMLVFAIFGAILGFFVPQ